MKKRLSAAASKRKNRNKENQPPGSRREAPNRPAKLCTWSNHSMLQAMAAVKDGSMGINMAAIAHGVPRTTLKDRLSGRVIHGTKMGPKSYLTREEEKELVDFLVNCSKMGYGKTRAEVLRIVEAVMKKKGRLLGDHHISQGWWCRFRERWPEISLRRGDSFSMAREKMTSREVFENYFDLLQETLDKYNLKDKPSQIYNCDESGLPLEHKPPRIVSAKGTRKVRQISSGNKTQITVLGCCNAAGQAIPPMVVFSGKRFNHELSKGEVPGTLYGMSDSGWMDQELFATWFSNHFLQHAVTSRPLLLMLDGHSSHYTLDLIQSAKDNDVVIFCLPPHTTADSQPLDTSCFGPLKAYWSEACRKYMFKNPGRVVSKFQFSQLFSGAWSKGMSISNITMGFRNTGIYPFSRDALLKKLPTSEVFHSDGEDEIPDGTSDDIVSAEKETDDEDEVLDEDGIPTGFSGDAEKESSQSNDHANGDIESVPVFAPESIKLFQTRLENGFNVFEDSEYVAWLQLYHPDCAPAPSLVASFSYVSPQQSMSPSILENSHCYKPTSKSSLSSKSLCIPEAPSVSYESDTGSRKYSEFLYFLSNLVDDTYAHKCSSVDLFEDTEY